MGVLGCCPGDVGGAGTCAGQGGNKPRARNRVRLNKKGSGTILHYVPLLGTIRVLMLKEKGEVQVCKCCGD